MDFIEELKSLEKVAKDLERKAGDITNLYQTNTLEQVRANIHVGYTELGKLQKMVEREKENEF